MFGYVPVVPVYPLGHIVGAEVTSITLLGKVNLTALKEFGSAGSRGDIIDK